LYPAIDVEKKNGIAAINASVAISAERSFIVLGQRKEPIRNGRRRLRCVIAEQLRSVIYRSIAIPIKREEGIIGTRRGPGEMFSKSITTEIEVYSMCYIRQTKAISRYVNQDGGGTAWVAR